MRRIAAIAAALSLSITGSIAQAAVTPEKRARRATHYLVANQNPDGSFPGFSPIGSTADAITSLVAAQRGLDAVESAVAYLESNSAEVDTIGEISKVVLALVAASDNPRQFAGRDLIQELQDSLQTDGQYGEHTEDPFDGEVTNHALAILALSSVQGGNPSDDALTWLIAAQCNDGGWQHTGPPTAEEDSHCWTRDPESDFFRSDTNTTSLAVQAIAAHPNPVTLENDPRRFFRNIRDPRRNGWGYSWDTRLTDSNSTALVIQAYVALGGPLPNGAMEALARLQYRWCGKKAGAFAFTWEENDAGRLRKTAPDVGATIGAIPGLLKEAFPIAPADISQSPPSPPAC